jgi:hypothetical protein
MPITRDTKNWTWVLERPCEECGFDASTIARADVGRLLRENAAGWQVVLMDADAGRRRNDDMWSALEYGCHVRDVYRICDFRLGKMLDEDDPTFPNWDQDETAEDEDYAHQHPVRVAAELEDAALTVADRFDELTAADWSRAGIRSDGARFTVESFARYIVHDVSHHDHDLRVLGFGV